MAGLPPMEMLSTPQLVARLLQTKTHKCTRTPSSCRPQPQPLSQCPVLQTQGSKPRERWQGRDGWKPREKFFPSPPCWALRVSSRPCSSGGLGGRPEWAGTPGHPVPPSLSHPDVGPLTALSAPQCFLDVQCVGAGS